MEEVLRRLYLMDACDPGTDWLESLHESTTPQDAWDKCTDGSWMFWLLYELSDWKQIPWETVRQVTRLFANQALEVWEAFAKKTDHVEARLPRALLETCDPFDGSANTTFLKMKLHTIAYLSPYLELEDESAWYALRTIWCWIDGSMYLSEVPYLARCAVYDDPDSAVGLAKQADMVRSLVSSDDIVKALMEWNIDAEKGLSRVRV